MASSPPLASAAAPGLFDLGGRDATRPPFRAFERLRSQGAVHYLPRHDCWIVLGYDTVRAVLSDPRLFSSDPGTQVDAVLLGADPPEHGAARRLVSAYVARAAQAQFTAGVAADASVLLSDRFDLVADFAVPLARRAGARLLGMAESDLNAILAAHDMDRPAGEIGAASRALLSRAGAWRVFAEAGGSLEEDRAYSLVRLLCRAATETTERLIVRAAATLLRNEGLRRRIQGDQALLAAFIEEMMRLYPPEPNVIRRTTGDVELGGAAIPAGASVLVSLLGANRDPAVFTDPDEIRLDRARAPHVAFGGGPHQCVGAGLGRRIALVALQSLLDPARPIRSAQPLDALDCAVDQGIETPRRLIVERGWADAAAAGAR